MLYAGAALNIFAVLAHSKICIEKFFPILDRSPDIGPALVFVTKSNYLMVSASWVSIGRSAVEVQYEDLPLTEA